MSRELAVEQLLLCEYITQDIQGKFVVAGIQSSAISFMDTKNANWSKIKIFCEMQPLQKHYAATILLRKVNGEDILKVDLEYKNEREPQVFERSVFNLDIPPTVVGDGETFLLQVVCNKKILKERRYEAFIGRSPNVTLGEVRITSIQPS